MNPRPTVAKSKWNTLARDDRARVRLAHMASGDTFSGSARALLLAKRLQRMGAGFWPLEVVSQVYSSSSGTADAVFGAWECYECGSVHVGRSAADACCQEEAHPREPHSGSYLRSRQGHRSLY